MNSNMVKGVLEMVGTFVFLSVILNTGNMGALQPLGVGIGLMAAVFLVGGMTGGHLNPAVTVMSAMAKTITNEQAMYYIVGQVAGGLAALYVSQQLKAL